MGSLILVLAFLQSPPATPGLRTIAHQDDFIAADGSCWGMRRDRSDHAFTLVGGASAPLPGDAREAALRFLQDNARELGIRPDRLVPHGSWSTPAGTLVRFAERIEGRPVFSGQARALVDEEGRLLHVYLELLPRSWAAEPGDWPPVGPARDAALRRARDFPLRGETRVAREEAGWLAGTGERAWRLRVDDELGPLLLVTVASDPPAIRDERRLRYQATLTVQVFDPNPVNRLNDTSLRDLDDADSAVPPQAYVTTTVEADPPSSGIYRLRGPFAHITNYYNPSDRLHSSADPTDFVFTRQPDPFEQVNAYYWVSRSGSYVEDLGFTLRNTPLAVEPHANLGVGAGAILFPLDGEPVLGYYGVLVFDDDVEFLQPPRIIPVDAAEEADILLHEHFHSVIHGLRGTDLCRGGEPHAIHEGSSDYWATSQTWEASIASGFDPHCLGEWWEEGGCTRRTDSDKMYPWDMGDPWEEPHNDGEIWSSFLTGLAEDLGDDFQTVDQLLLMGITLVEPKCSYLDLVDAMVEADRLLFASAHTSEIRAAAAGRGITIQPTPEVSPKGSDVPVRVRRRDDLLRLLWEDLGAAAEGYNVYEGILGDWYRFPEAACGVQGDAGPPGYRQLDWAPSFGDRYYLVTAYANDYEGTAGCPDLPPGSQCPTRAIGRKWCDP